MAVTVISRRRWASSTFVVAVVALLSAVTGEEARRSPEEQCVAICQGLTPCSELTCQLAAARQGCDCIARRLDVVSDEMELRSVTNGSVVVASRIELASELVIPRSSNVSMSSPETSLLGGMVELVSLGGRIVTVEGDLLLSRMTLRDGVEYEGGCVYVGGVLTARDTTFVNCTAFNGGAIAAGPGAHVNLQRSMITGCLALRNGGGFYGAGSVLTMTGSSIELCHAFIGGGIASDTVAGEVYLVESTIQKSTATNSAGGCLTPAGGVFSLVDATIANCSSKRVGGGVLQRGGAEYRRSHVVRCHAMNAEGQGGLGAFGGGIFDFNSGVSSRVAFLDGSSVRDCSAPAGGGGIHGAIGVTYLFENSFVSGCSSEDGAGGGIAAQADLELRDSSISRCSALLGGGGVYADQQGVKVLRVTDSAFLENVASREGGAIVVPRDARLFVLRSLFQGNSADVGGALASSGGQIWLMAGTVLRQNSASKGGAVAFYNANQHSSHQHHFLNSRLFVSGDTCSFVQLTLDFSLARDPLSATTAHGLIQEHATKSVVDSLGESMVVTPIVGLSTSSGFCLPAGLYNLEFAARRGGTEWEDARASLLGSSSSNGTTEDGSTFFSLPGDDASWKTRMATHHRFELAESLTRGGPVLLEKNTAWHGGAFFLEDAVKIAVKDALFVENFAVENGGAVFMGSETELHVADVEFTNNTACRSGGGLHATASTRLRMDRILASNNTADTKGGFGLVEDASTLLIAGSTFRSNTLKELSAKASAGFGGGALSFDGVRAARLENSTFTSNRVDRLGGEGGAVLSRHSNLTFDGVFFAENSASTGNGGAVALVEGVTEWALPEEPCSLAQVIVDYTTTTAVCGQFVLERDNLCDAFETESNFCVDKADVEDNPYYDTDDDDVEKMNVCAGCSCTWEYLKYFKLLKGEEEVLVYDTLNNIWDPRGVGASDTVVAYTFCLEKGDYSIAAFDELGQGWWGASLSVHVYEEALVEYNMPGWAGFNSDSVEFEVGSFSSKKEVATNVFESNEAAAGGGGACFWTDDREPLGMWSVEFQNNKAGYGSDVATAAVRLFLAGEEEPGLISETTTSGDVVRPYLTVRLLDAYNATVASDSASPIFATCLEHELDSTQGAVEVVSEGVATFDALTFSIRSGFVDLQISFTAPTLPFLEGVEHDRRIRVVFPPKPQKDDRDGLPSVLRAVILLLVVVNITFVVICAAWTMRFRKRLIVELSQPRYLYLLCVGCLVSTVSSAAPLLSGGLKSVGCQLILWLYGAGFIITTTALYAKMTHMEAMVDYSLKVAGSNKLLSTKITRSSSGSRVMDQVEKKPARSPTWGRSTAALVAVAMAAGELLILTSWAVIAPLKYKRSCTEKEKGGPWVGACVESVGKCRTTRGPEFATALALYHFTCVLVGIHRCYRVRNLPSVMAESRWVFTGFYSQLQVFLTAVPVLALVRDDYAAFTVLKSLVICLSDATTLAMIYLPKMCLVYVYGDFSKTALAAYVAKSLVDSTQRDSVYEQLRTTKSATVPSPAARSSRSRRSLPTKKQKSFKRIFFFGQQGKGDGDADEESFGSFATGALHGGTTFVQGASLDENKAPSPKTKIRLSPGSSLPLLLSLKKEKAVAKELAEARAEIAAQEKLALQQAHEMRNKYTPAIGLLRSMCVEVDTLERLVAVVDEATSPTTGGGKQRVDPALVPTEKLARVLEDMILMKPEMSVALELLVEGDQLHQSRLDCFKILLGNYVSTLETFSLREMVQGRATKERAIGAAHNLVSGSATRSGDVSYAIDLGGGDVGDYIVRADHYVMNHVLSNLLSNARKKTFKGEIRVSFQGKKRGLLRFLVRDSGTGMSQTMASKLFKAEVTTGDSRGTGLGLPSCKLFCEAVGGECSLAKTQLQDSSGHGGFSEFFFSVSGTVVKKVTMDDPEKLMIPVSPRIPAKSSPMMAELAALIPERLRPRPSPGPMPHRNFKGSNNFSPSTPATPPLVELTPLPLVIRVVVVDDAPSIRKVLMRAIKNFDKARNPWKFEEFATAEAAQARLLELKDDPLTMVTVDHNLESQGGVMKGTELIRWLVEHSYRGVIASVTGDPEESANHLLCGAQCAWGKPIHHDAVHADIRKFALDNWLNIEEKQEEPRSPTVLRDVSVRSVSSGFSTDVSTKSCLSEEAEGVPEEEEIGVPEEIRVLLIDDAPSIRKILKRAISTSATKTQWTFEEFSTAEAAQPRLMELKDDPRVLVTVDHNMETQGGLMKGSDLIKWLVLREFCGIVVSVTGDPEEAKRHLDLGAAAVWQKPIPKNDVHADLAKWRAKNAWKPKAKPTDYSHVCDNIFRSSSGASGGSPLLPPC